MVMRCLYFAFAAVTTSAVFVALGAAAWVLFQVWLLGTRGLPGPIDVGFGLP